MSATSEILYEQIKQLDDQISEGIRSKKDVAALQQQRQGLVERLMDANKAINEGRTILKD